MTALSWSPSASQLKFLDIWRSSGGVNATLDAMIARAPEKLVATVMAGGVWRNFWMCDTHHEMNGAVYFGDLHRFLPAPDFSAFHTQHLRTVKTGIPHRTRAIGSVGAARSTLTHRISVPVRPPPGADWAIVSSYEWEKVVPAALYDPLKGLLRRCYGEELVARMGTVGDIPLRLQIELIRGMTLSVKSQDYLAACLAKKRFEEEVFFDAPMDVPR